MSDEDSEDETAEPLLGGQRVERPTRNLGECLSTWRMPALGGLIVFGCASFVVLPHISSNPSGGVSEALRALIPVGGQPTVEAAAQTSHGLENLRARENDAARANRYYHERRSAFLSAYADPQHFARHAAPTVANGTAAVSGAAPTSPVEQPTAPIQAAPAVPAGAASPAWSGACGDPQWASCCAQIGARQAATAKRTGGVVRMPETIPGGDLEAPGVLEAALSARAPDGELVFMAVGDTRDHRRQTKDPALRTISVDFVLNLLANLHLLGREHYIILSTKRLCRKYASTPSPGRIPLPSSPPPPLLPPDLPTPSAGSSRNTASSRACGRRCGTTIPACRSGTSNPATCSSCGRSSGATSRERWSSAIG